MGIYSCISAASLAWAARVSDVMDAMRGGGTWQERATSGRYPDMLEAPKLASNWNHQTTEFTCASAAQIKISFGTENPKFEQMRKGNDKDHSEQHRKVGGWNVQRGFQALSVRTILLPPVATVLASGTSADVTMRRDTLELSL